MTRQHYIAIAAILAEAQPVRDTLWYADWRGCVEELASYFRTDNPAFDSIRFYDACGYEPWKDSC